MNWADRNANLFHQAVHFLPDRLPGRLRLLCPSRSARRSSTRIFRCPASASWCRRRTAAEPLISLNADRAMNPASTMKLLTTFAVTGNAGPRISLEDRGLSRRQAGKRRAAGRPGVQGLWRPEADRRAILDVVARIAPARAARDTRRYRAGPQLFRSGQARIPPSSTMIRPAHTTSAPAHCCSISMRCICI